MKRILLIVLLLMARPAFAAWSMTTNRTSIFSTDYITHLYMSAHAAASSTIAFDNFVDSGYPGSTNSLSFSMTSSGTNRMVLVGVLGDVIGTGPDDVTGVTYGGSSMTFIAKNTGNSGTSGYTYLFCLTGQATGSQTVVVSSTTSHRLQAGAASYTGVSATACSSVDATGSNHATSNVATLTSSITAATDAWAFLFEYGYTSGNTPPTAGAGLALRGVDATFGSWGFFDSNRIAANLCTGTSPNLVAASWDIIGDCHTIAVTGDTITVTPGSYTVTAHPLTLTKSVTIVATGVTLTDNTCAANACLSGSGGSVPIENTDAMIAITETAAGYIRIQSATNNPLIVNEGSGGSHRAPAALINITGGSSTKPVIVSGLTYNTFTTSADTFHLRTNHGVFSHMKVTAIPNGTQCITTVSFLRVAYGDYTNFPNSSEFGSLDTTGENKIYIEDSEFDDAEEAVDIDDNGRVAFRNNTFKASAIILHGDTSIPGGRYVEVYHNNQLIRDETVPQPGCDMTGGGLAINFTSFMSWRAGTAIIYGNVLQSPAFQVGGGTCTDVINGNCWNRQGTNMKFLGWALRRFTAQAKCWSATGGNGQGLGYPMPYEVGWGWTTGNTSIGPYVVTVSGIDSSPRTTTQDLEPAYTWGNTGDGNYLTPSVQDFNDADSDSCVSHGVTVGLGNASTYIQNDREYYVDTGAYTSGAITSGIKSGTGVPSMGCTVGVGFWSASQNTLYKCTATNTWNPLWTPFTYPHPLASEPTITKKIYFWKKRPED